MYARNCVVSCPVKLSCNELAALENAQNGQLGRRLLIALKQLRQALIIV